MTASRHPRAGYAVKRSVRAALVVPAAFAIATVLSTNTQVQLFAAFGSISLMVFVDFPGTPQVKLRSLCLLIALGAVFVVAGTLCSEEPVAAVAAMAVVGFCVLFAGILSPLASAATVAALLTFVLPVAVVVPPGQIPARLVGWLLAGALAVPSILFLWPRPFRDELRRKLAVTSRSLAVLAAAHAEGRLDRAALDVADATLVDLREQFESTSFPPTGAGPAESAVAKLVGRMEWVGANAVLSHRQAAVLERPEVSSVNRAVAEVLSASAPVIGDDQGRPTGDRPALSRLADAVERLQRELLRSREVNLQHLMDGTAGRRAEAALRADDPTGHRRPDRLLEVLDPTFRTRALGMAAVLVAEAASEASGQRRAVDAADRRRELSNWGSAHAVLASHVNRRSIWFRNSVRGAVGLALAVAVVELTDVEHGFWVILGALSVLRSNALGTGATVVRALAGTIVGFVVGSAIMVGVAGHQDLLWAILPPAVLVSAIAPTRISFAAGQAAFTVLVVVLFNIIQPTGWRVGLTRIEDVALGCLVSLVVGVLFWPRGASAALGRALSEAFVAGSAYLFRAVERTSSPADEVDTDPDRRASEAAYERLDDAFRQYVAERGAKPVAAATATCLVSGAVRIRIAAYSLATLPTDPTARSVEPLETVTAAGDSLRRSCDTLHHWFVSACRVLAGGSDHVPAVRRHDAGLHTLLVDAFADASRQGRAGNMRRVLRMLWADETLEDAEILQHELAGAVEAFATRRRG